MNERYKINLAKANDAGKSAYKEDEYVIQDEASCSAEFTSGCIFSE